MESPCSVFSRRIIYLKITQVILSAHQMWSISDPTIRLRCLLEDRDHQSYGRSPVYWDFFHPWFNWHLWTLLWNSGITSSYCKYVLKKKNRKKESKHMKNLLCQDTFQHWSYSSFLLSTEKIKQIMNKLKPLNTLFTILV